MSESAVLQCCFRIKLGALGRWQTTLVGESLSADTSQRDRLTNQQSRD
jgi:hypothetical protein